MSDHLQIIRKRLLWRATHRGIKEMDILIGGYAQSHLVKMSETELSEFEALLEIPDQDLLSWATHQENVPAQLACTMLTDILTYRPETNK